MVLLFATALFTSSALLFVVEPLIAKAILPLLGGTPAVWNTCMVFYQLALLAGYVYAHALSRSFTRSKQIAIHAVVVGLSVASLPILVTSTSQPPVDSSPILWLFATLLRTAGAPLFVISSTSPLLQRWFTSATKRNPYPLYAAGNAGSILALISYPALLEPLFTLKRQSVLWAVGYIAFMLLTLACGVYTRQRVSGTDNLLESPVAPASDRPSTWLRTKWIALAAVPSSLMLGVTTFLTTDIAAVPLLWIVPLGLYLFTFVLVFAERQILPHRLMVRLMPLLVVPLITLVTFYSELPLLVHISLHLSAFFVISMVCHGELARLKPATEHLTTFYLCLAVGGVVGGMFNAIVSPLLFNSVIEYPIMIILACALRPAIGQGERQRWTWSDVIAPATLGGAVLATMFIFQGGESKGLGDLLLVFVIPGVVLFSFRERSLRFALGVASLTVASMTYMSVHESILHRGRSFFGAHRITLDNTRRYRVFVNGGIVHGAQSTDPLQQDEPTTYFHRHGPIGQVFAAVAPDTRSRVGVIGLGIGTLAAYSRPQEQWTFFEIDPAVIAVAGDRRYFTFLQDAAAPVKILAGDARLSIARIEDHQFDLLILDAFSSDAIPVHLLTREALALYLRKVSQDGVMAFHISNRYLELRPLLADLASSFDLVCFAQDDLNITDADQAAEKFPSRWVLMAHRASDLGALPQDSRWQRVGPRSRRVVWTDEFSNLLGVFKWRG
jgi:spermidine synthase